MPKVPSVITVIFAFALPDKRDFAANAKLYSR